MNSHERLGRHPKFKNYTHVDDGALKHAVDKYHISSMIDVGCGVMGMAKSANHLGITYVGVDGDPDLVGGENFILHDYNTGPLTVPAGINLAWAVEFVEHVDEIYIPNFMATLLCANYVCMTHALPNQSGYHHVNLKIGEYWVEVFKKYGFELDPETTKEIRTVSTMKHDYMRNTGMFFKNCVDIGG